MGPQAALGRRTAARLAQLEERRSAKREAVTSNPSRTTSRALKTGDIMRTVMKTVSCIVQVIASFVGGDVEPLALSPSFLHISLPRTMARSSGFLIQRGRSYFSSWQRIMGLVYPSQRPLRQRLRSIARYSLIPYSRMLRNV